MYETVFLIALALIWVLVASIYDIKKRLVFNWLSFSLIIFALGFRFFYSLFNENLTFFYQGLIGLGIFFLLGNFFYYTRMFAGGDAKLMMALGPVLPLSTSFHTNLKILILFFLLFLLAGAIYGIGWSIYLFSKEKKKLAKEVKVKLKKFKIPSMLLMILGLLFMAIGFYDSLFFYLGVMVFLSPYLYVYSKAIDDVCLVKNVKTKNLEEGDWLYKDFRVKGKIIKADWGGLSKKQIAEIRKQHKSVMIREGIPFVPTFLIALLVLTYIWLFNQELFSLLPWF